MRHWMDAIHTYEGRGVFERPVCASLDGRMMTIATDGRFLIAVPGDEPGAVVASPAELVALASTERAIPAGAGVTYSLASLRAFVGGDYLAPDVPCPDCDNVGTITCPECRGSYGDQVGGCERCDDEGSVTCAKCAAEWGNKKRRIRIGGRLFDAGLVAAALRRVPGEAVTWVNGGPRDPALVRGWNGWLVLIMPMRDDAEFVKYHGQSPELVPEYAEVTT